MNKNIKNIVLMLFFIIFCFEVLLHSNVAINCMKTSYDIWINNVFPSLFPIMCLSGILIDLNLPYVLGKLTNVFMNKIFNLNSNAAFIFIMSMLSGCPSNAIYTRKLYKNGDILLHDASMVLMFTHFSSPLFILNSVSIFLNNSKVSIYILVIHYLTNILIALIFRGRNKSNYVTSKAHKDINIGLSITNSITKSVNTCLMILGVISFSSVLINIIQVNFCFNDYINSILGGLIEMTNGLKLLSSLDLSLKIKTTLSIFFISFGGLSIHLQILSIINDTNIKYKYFFVGRIIHAFVSSIIAYIFFDIFI